jgi:hypothetical protein
MTRHHGHGKGEDSHPRGCGFESWPCCRYHLSYTINLDQKHKGLNYGKVTWHCCMCCNSANSAKGSVEFEDCWLIKSSFIIMDEMKACQLTWTKLKKIMASKLF